MNGRNNAWLAQKQSGGFFRWLTLDAAAVQSRSRFQKNHPSWSLLVIASTASAEPARRSV
jgi:hypothetical protein